MSDPYTQQHAWQPPPSRRSNRGLMITLTLILSVLLIGVAVVTVYAVSRSDKPAVPTNATTTEPAAPAGDMGAGTPGANCATNRLGKTFVKDGITYTCGGPKPYHWLPPG